MTPEEREATQRMVVDVSGDASRYVPMRVPGQDRQFYLIDLSKYTVAGMLSKQNLQNLFIDPLMGGVYKPIIEAAFAHANGTGEGPFSQQFGRRVFYPHENPTQKAQSTVNFFRTAYQPTTISLAEGLMRQQPLIVDQELAETYALRSGRFTNTDAAQVMMRLGGIRNQKVDTERGGITFRSALIKVGTKYRGLRDSLMARYRKMAKDNGTGYLTVQQNQAFAEEQRRMSQAYTDEMQKLMGTTP
jgi:hypothetical protein